MFVRNEYFAEWTWELCIKKFQKSWTTRGWTQKFLETALLRWGVRVWTKSRSLTEKTVKGSFLLTRWTLSDLFLQAVSTHTEDSFLFWKRWGVRRRSTYRLGSRFVLLMFTMRSELLFYYKSCVYKLYLRENAKVPVLQPPIHCAFSAYSVVAQCEQRARYSM